MNRLLKLTQWITTCLVFFALPLLLIAYGFGLRWHTLEQDSIEASYRALDNLLLTFRKKEDTKQFLSQLIFLLHRRADITPNRVDTLKRGIASLKKRFPKTLKFTVTDENGDIISELTDGSPSKYVVKRLYEVISKYPPREEGVRLNDVMHRKIADKWAVFQSFIGKEAPLGKLDLISQSFFEVSYLEEGRWFCYITSPKGGLFVHANYTPEWPLLAVKDVMARFMKTRAQRFGVEVGVYDFFSSASISAKLALAVGEFQRSRKEHHFIGDSLFTVMAFTPTSCLWASRPRNAALDFTNYRLFLTAIITILFGIATIISYLVIVREITFKFPIRWRLVVLFGFASGIPLVVVTFSGWDYLDQKYKMRIREAHDEEERALRAFDARFTQMRSMMALTFSKQFANCYSDNGLERILTIIKTFMRYFNTDNIVLYDSKGDTAFKLYSGTRKEDSKRAQKMFGLISAQVIANLNREPYSGKLDTASLIFETVAQGENLASYLTREVGNLLNLAVAGSEIWTLMIPIKAKNGRVTHMLVGYWKKVDLERTYLEKYLIPSQRVLPGLRLYAWNDKGKNTPRDFRFAGKVIPLIENLKLRQSTVTSQIRAFGETWLATGIKPKELANHMLVGLMPKWPIVEEMRLLERRLKLFIGMIVIMSIFLGINLSRRFLTPISGLAQGVDAIQKRRFQFRVPEAGQDELGDLAKTFNNVMEGLADLEVARIVQESLFPRNEIKEGEYAVYGESHTMTALGGDYFELQKLADGRVLILIGDVSGHGVPAALVMAMAKALVERESEQAASSPQTILETIHRVFYRTLKRKRMMTCFLAVLDPSAHKLQFSNAGHNYPVRFRQGEKPAFLELNGMPLGSVKKNAISSAEIDLLPGDRIMFYTDGLVETKIGAQEIGYQRLCAETAALLCDDAKKSCENVFAWHAKIAPNAEQQDDITVVILTRVSQLHSSLNTIT